MSKLDPESLKFKYARSRTVSNSSEESDISDIIEHEGNSDIDSTT